MQPCFKILASADSATVSLFDEIGFWGTQAKDFIGQVKAITASTINLEINSPGGDVFDALAMYNVLKASGKEIVVKVLGVAASAASLVAMVGDKIVMPKNTFLMIHNPWTVAAGNADDMRETADVLDKIGASLVGIYTARTGRSEQEIKDLLAKDTWLSADEAKELGFATDIVDDVKAKAEFDMTRADLPEHIKALFAEEKPADPESAAVAEPPAAPEPVQTLTDQMVACIEAAGMSKYTAVLALECSAMDKLQSRIAEVRDIEALCKIVNKDASGFVFAHKTLEQTRSQLMQDMAAADQHTDNSRKNESDAKASASSSVGTKSIWNSHLNQKGT